MKVVGVAADQTLRDVEKRVGFKLKGDRDWANQYLCQIDAMDREHGWPTGLLDAFVRWLRVQHEGWLKTIYPETLNPEKTVFQKFLKERELKESSKEKEKTVEVKTTPNTQTTKKVGKKGKNKKLKELMRSWLEGIERGPYLKGKNADDPYKPFHLFQHFKRGMGLRKVLQEGDEPAVYKKFLKELGYSDEQIKYHMKQQSNRKEGK